MLFFLISKFILLKLQKEGERMIQTNRRVRSINQVAAFFQERDPDTAITNSAIRKAVKDGSIPSVSIGTRKLIVLEDVAHYFNVTITDD